MCTQTRELRGGTALAWGAQEGCLEEVCCSEIVGSGAQKGLSIHFLLGNSDFWLPVLNGAFSFMVSANKGVLLCARR